MLIVAASTQGTHVHFTGDFFTFLFKSFSLILFFPSLISQGVTEEPQVEKAPNSVLAAHRQVQHCPELTWQTRAFLSLYGVTKLVLRAVQKWSLLQGLADTSTGAVHACSCAHRKAWLCHPCVFNEWWTPHLSSHCFWGCWVYTILYPRQIKLMSVTRTPNPGFYYFQILNHFPFGCVGMIFFFLFFFFFFVPFLPRQTLHPISVQHAYVPCCGRGQWGQDLDINKISNSLNHLRSLPGCF